MAVTREMTRRARDILALADDEREIIRVVGRLAYPHLPQDQAARRYAADRLAEVLGVEDYRTETREDLAQ